MTPPQRLLKRALQQSSSSRDEASDGAPDYTHGRRHDGQGRIAKLVELPGLPRSLLQQVGDAWNEGRAQDC